MTIWVKSKLFGHHSIRKCLSQYQCTWGISHSYFTCRCGIGYCKCCCVECCIAKSQLERQCPGRIEKLQIVSLFITVLLLEEFGTADASEFIDFDTIAFGGNCSQCFAHFCFFTCTPRGGRLLGSRSCCSHSGGRLWCSFARCCAWCRLGLCCCCPVGLILKDWLGHQVVETYQNDKGKHERKY